VEYFKATEDGVTQEYLEKRSGERNVDSGLQVQLEEYEDGNTIQS